MTGKRPASWLSHRGPFSGTKKIPETKVNGSTRTAVIGWAESALGMTAVATMPRAVKHTMPASNATPRPGIVETRIWVPKAAHPVAKITATSSVMARAEAPMRPAMYAHAGSGVPRTRFNTPWSRSRARLEARFEESGR